MCVCVCTQNECVDARVVRVRPYHTGCFEGLITQGKQARLINNAVFWLVSCGLRETTNGTRHGEHEQRARRSQPDNDATTRLRGHITAQRATLPALVLELHQQVPRMVLWRPPNE